MAPDLPAERLADVVRRVYSRGWCEGTSGNYSLVLSRDPLRLLITRTGIDKRTTGPEDFLVVGPDAEPLEGTVRPSAETPLHVALAESGAESVLHTHSVWGTLLGLRHLKESALRITGYEMIKGIAGHESHENTLVVPIFPNTQDMPALATEVRAMVAKDPGVRGFLIAGHGLYTWGIHLDQAYRHVEVFEFLFEAVGRSLPAA